ncbi:MAG: hypothetical protein OXG85_04865 [Chloroflexi bacterium]|nr:hypothetical protein [Chloroflexota bacterium]
MIDGNLILGFVGGLVAVLGGVWTAYRLLGHAVYRELDQQRERIGNLESNVDNQNTNVNNRLGREMAQRHQSEKEAQDGRANLSARILVLESEFRRGPGGGQAD